jgi:hypothetical protein
MDNACGRIERLAFFGQWVVLIASPHPSSPIPPLSRKGRMKVGIGPTNAFTRTQFTRIFCSFCLSHKSSLDALQGSGFRNFFDVPESFE